MLMRKKNEETYVWFVSSNKEVFESATCFFRWSSSSWLIRIARSRSRCSAVTLSWASDFLLSSIAFRSSSSSRFGLFPASPFVDGLLAVSNLLLLFSSSNSPGSSEAPRIIRSRILALARLSCRSLDSSWRRLVISFAFCLTLAPWSFPSSSTYWNSLSVLTT